MSLLFVAGIMWGYLAKTLANKNLYIGHDDAQVIDAQDVYKVKRSQAITTENQPTQNEQEYVAPEATPGTVGI